ncbi:hypothetical protein EM20IM_04270 [Candidatus Methylacidiphilum infernorum]|uniref:Uncharacterized protein n=1 Tax=Candidatus Methylacidiphilum infernorum TaxID=511746 RepID=A0ABX7PX20_9BACT|nr:hypothetical protein [Candidatus Methylacidiphilum infernorum]QSR87544.1 hypothetical protein EM20IM_04270 [Candidatus Methylacidiphilum infernorum]
MSNPQKVNLHRKYAWDDESLALGEGCIRLEYGDPVRRRELIKDVQKLV